MDLGGQEILVVDDIRFTRLTIVRMLSQLGATAVHEAENGAVALAFLEQRGAAVTCVITDLEMPGLDGIGLLKAIRAGVGSIPRDLKVVVLTGHSELDRLGPALLLDLDAFLSKPASIGALQGCLERVLGARKGAGEASIADPGYYRTIPLALSPAAEDRPAACNERAIDIDALSADAVLSRDLLFGNGRLLLRADTHLNPRLLERLRELAPLANLSGDVWIEA